MDYRAVAKGSDLLLNNFFLSVWVPAHSPENLHGKHKQLPPLYLFYCKHNSENNKIILLKIGFPPCFQSIH